MNQRMKWLLMSMLVSLGRCIVCPDDGHCSSQVVNYGTCEIRCPSDSNPKFIARYKVYEGRYQMECHHVTSWSETGYQSILPSDGHWWTLSIERCPLPDESFGHIMQRFGLMSAYALKFTSRMNLSTTLTRRHLSMLSGIRTLNLSSNGLTELPSDLFRDLRELHDLDLSFNQIAMLPHDIFHSLSSLLTLDLSYTAMKFVDWRLFGNCTELGWLSLRGNLFTSLDHRTFRDINNVYNIDLAENLLETLPPDTFKYISLHFLDISGNRFSTLPEELLRWTELWELTFGHNRGNLTALPMNFLNNLTMIEKVLLVRNDLNSLPEDILWGSFSVQSVDLHGNVLSTLPENIFRDSTSLSSLDLSDNRLNYLPVGLFGALTKLRRLNLARNSIASLSEDIFKNLGSLLELNLEINNITDIHPATFRKPQNIRLIRLSHNSVNVTKLIYLELDEYFYGPTIEEIFLDHNNLTGELCIEKVESDNAMNLQLVDLTYNQISNVHVRSSSIGSRDVEYDLRHNNLQSFIIKNDVSSKVNILADDNPFECGCKLYVPLKYMHEIRRSQSEENLKIFLGNASCNEPYWMKGTPVSSLRLETFTCRLDINNNFVRCAEGCDCWWRPHDETRIVDCSSRNLAKMPDEIIDFVHDDDSKFLPDLGWTARVRWFHWRHTPVELDFANNSLAEISTLKVSAYKYVEKLILSYNNISKLSLDVVPPKVKTLHLDHNDLEGFDRVFLNAIINSTTLRDLYLEGNPLSCDADTRSALDLMENKLGPNLRYSMKECLDYRNPPNIKKTSTLFISYAIF